MKKIIYFILFILIFTFTENVFWLNIIYNTEPNIKKAILVENYIYRHKNNVTNFTIKYNIWNNKIISKNIDELNGLIIALEKIQNTNIKKERADNILQAVIKKIKKINESLKIQLKIEKDIFEKNLKSKKIAFSKLWIKISNKLDSINLLIARKIFKNKNNFSEKELQIKQNLIKLDKESLKLKNFTNTTFQSEKEIKDFFVIILQNIKIEINSMKHILK